MKETRSRENTERGIFEKEFFLRGGVLEIKERERERERAERTEMVYLKRNMFEAVNNKRNFDEEGRINRSKGSKNWNV